MPITYFVHISHFPLNNLTNTYRLKAVTLNSQTYPEEKEVPVKDYRFQPWSIHLLCNLKQIALPQFYKLLRDLKISISKQWCAGSTNLTLFKQLFPFLLLLLFLVYSASSRGLEESSAFTGLQKKICSYKKIICSGHQNTFLHSQYGPWRKIQQVPTNNDVYSSLWHIQ